LNPTPSVSGTFFELNDFHKKVPDTSDSFFAFFCGLRKFQE